MMTSEKTLPTFSPLSFDHSYRKNVGTLRYIEALRVGDTLPYFYEMARPDFAHELRTIAVPLR